MRASSEPLPSIAEICDPPMFVIWPSDIRLTPDLVHSGKVWPVMYCLEFGHFGVAVWERARRIIEGEEPWSG